MSAIQITNKTSQQLSFEALCLTLQGEFAVVRKAVPPGQIVTVELPVGVSASAVANSVQVQKEYAAGNPNYTIAAVADASLVFVPGLSAGQTLSETQAVAASATVGLVGTPTTPGYVQTLNVVAPVASAAGESYSVQFTKNGTNIGSAVAIPASTPANTLKSLSVGSLKITANPGDVFAAVVTYTAGGTPTPLANVTSFIQVG